MSFSQPAYLFLLLLLIPIIGWYIWRMHDSDASLRVSGTSSLHKHAMPAWVLHVPFVLRVLAVALL